MRPDDLAALADELRPDMLGLWLPLALADILCAWCDADREQILRSWKLDAMADRISNAKMDSFLAELGKGNGFDGAGNGNPRPWRGKPLQGADNGRDGKRDEQENGAGHAPDWEIPAREAKNG